MSKRSHAVMTLDDGWNRVPGRQIALGRGTRDAEQDAVRIKRAPPEPTAADIQSYHADTMTAKAQWYGLPLPDLDSVKTAIRMIAVEGYCGSLARTVAAMPSDSVAGFLVLRSATLDSPGRFVQQILDDLDDTFSGFRAEWPAPERRPSYLHMLHAQSEGSRYADKTHFYEGKWEYDGHGPFFKANLSVKALAAGGYELHLYQAGTGNKVEVEFARAHGIRMGFSYCTLHRTWIGTGDRFAIPVAFFAEALAALGSDADPASVAEAFCASQNGAIVRPSLDQRQWFQLPGTSLPAYAEVDMTRMPHDTRRRREACLAVADGAITGPVRIHENGRPYAAGLTLTLLPQARTTADEDACVAALERLRALAPDLKPAF